MITRNNYIRIIILACIAAFSGVVCAQNTKWFKKARKAQLNIITYDAAGQILHSTNGFFVGDDGTALSDYASFKGATKAVAIDESGKEWPVTCIEGASALYDVVKIHVDAKKPAPLHIAAINAVKGQPAYVMPYLSSKASVPLIAEIDKVENFNERFAYYTLKGKTTEKTTACPVMNDDGEVIGLLQMDASGSQDQCFAIAADYAMSLKTSAMER